MATGNVSFAPRRSTIGRTAAGLLALSYPLLMVVMALAVGSRQPGDLQDFAAVYEVMAEFFDQPYPARACVQVAALPKAVDIEVEAILAL